MAKPLGIDISRWQGNFNWTNHGGLSFGMAKATEGLSMTDPEFGHNWDSMWNYQAHHRLPRFAYHFFHAAEDPRRQAEHLVSTARRHGLLPGDNFVLDVESTVPGELLNDGIPPFTCAARAVHCLHQINTLAPGHRVLPYMNPAWARAGGSADMGSWFLWIANYGVLAPDVPPPWSEWTFWQTSDSPIDTDMYNGTEAELLAFTRMPGKR